MAPLDGTEADPSVRLPRAVRAAARRAEQISEAVYHPEQQAAEPAPSGEQQAAEPIPPVEQNAAPVGEPPVVEPPPAAPVVEDWEQKYRTLQGKYDSEIGRVNRELDSFRQLLATMHTAAPVAQAPAPARVETTTVVVPEDDVTAYGPELIDAARRWARAEIEPELRSMRDKLEKLEGGQVVDRVQSARNHVMAVLDADVEIGKIWRDINQDQRFVDWLGQADPLTGARRGEWIGRAFDAGDAARTKKFFTSFLSEHTAAVPAPAPLPTQTAPVTPAPAGGDGLERFAAPGRGVAAAPATPGGAPSEKRVWTRAQIAAFYHDCTHGKYAGRDEQRTALERDIHAAAMEGRIT